jgi:hypothetical protein
VREREHFCVTECVRGVFCWGNWNNSCGALQDVFVVLIGVSNGLGRMIAGYTSDRYAAKLPRPVFLGIAVSLMSLATLFVAFSNYTMLYFALPLVGACQGALRAGEMA